MRPSWFPESPIRAGNDANSDSSTLEFIAHTNYASIKVGTSQPCSWSKRPVMYPE